jgi:hypothetical protein
MAETVFPRTSIHDPVTTLEEDWLDRQRLANLLLRRMREDDCTAVGIYGGWGTGKSSVLNLLQILNEKEENKPLHIELIDAWQYEMTGSLFEPIIVRLRQLADKDGGFKDGKTYFQRMWADVLLGSTDWALKRLGLSLEDVRKYRQDVDQMTDTQISVLDFEQLRDDVKQTTQAFHEVIRLAIKGAKTENPICTRIVLAIDNLDRCSPESAINLLESVKNFLVSPGCVWVFAIDSGVMASYINKKYEGTTINGSIYLDKIVPDQYHLSLDLEQDRDREGIFRLIHQASGGRLGAANLALDRFAHIPQVLVPRRLIKSARKAKEFLEIPRDQAVDQNTIFALILLYHSWPGFYEYLSSASFEHVTGILANFNDPDLVLWGHRPLPLPSVYREDQDLKCYLIEAFHEDSDVATVVAMLNSLREVGLP